jgi:peptide chain release factor
VIRLLVTAGRGPAECRIAAAQVLAVMAREAEAAGLNLDVTEGRNPDGHGPSSAIAIVSGPGEERFAKGWTGSVQWIAESPLRPLHKRKNWFIGVMELPAPSAPPKPLDLKAVRFEAFRAGGPGGQHQNKTESAVRAVHTPSGLAAVARNGRSQHRNKAMALERLAALIEHSGELARIEDRHDVRAGHDKLERGNPTRCFQGRNFEPV